MLSDYYVALNRHAIAVIHKVHN